MAAALWRNRFRALALIGALASAGPVASVAAATFHPGCPLPYDAIKHHHPIDSTCDTTGKSTASAKAKHANGAKNDFCATGTPSQVTFVTFAKLQTASDQRHVHFGGPTVLPPDRSVLHNIVSTTNGDRIGEGSLVQVVGFVHHALYSDVTSGGESCNCATNGNENNDIHIYVVSSLHGSPCAGIVAEMSPHFRPLAWTDDAVNGVGSHPVRITGALFFDSAHKPCKGGQAVGSNPPRKSLWEIHPIYACDVCKKVSLADCPVEQEDIWTRLDQFHP